MDVLVPFVYQDLDVTGFSGNDLSLGDIFVEPVTLSWHLDRFDISFGYGLWFPTGDFSQTNPISPGKGFITHMLTGGITVYTDEEKKWSISALSRYEFSHEQDKTLIAPGDYYTIEYGLARQVTGTIEAGLVGYVQTQTTMAKFPDATAPEKESAVAYGPEVTYAIPKLGFFSN